jgi:hypothetical protein
LLEYEESPNYLLSLKVCERGMTGSDDRMDMPETENEYKGQREGTEGIK